MNEKEYKVEYYDNYIKLTEVEHESSYPMETDTKPTLRERIGKRMRGTSKHTKLILTLFLNIYGIFYRLGSNRSLSVMFGFVQFNITLAAIIMSFFNEAYYVFLPFVIFLLLILIIDLISILATGDILFVKMKKYKNYWER